jgi:hypothetical protein
VYELITWGIDGLNVHMYCSFETSRVLVCGMKGKMLGNRLCCCHRMAAVGPIVMWAVYCHFQVFALLQHIPLSQNPLRSITVYETLGEWIWIITRHENIHSMSSSQNIYTIIHGSKKIWGVSHFLELLLQDWSPLKYYLERNDSLCGLVVRVPGDKSRGQDSIPVAAKFSET